jgi:hypothetical protein
MRCKAGDVAFIMNGDIAQNIGRPVDVLIRAPDYVDGRPAWVIGARGEPILGYAMVGLELQVRAGQVSRCPDDWLRPYRPGPSADIAVSGERTEASA